MEQLTCSICNKSFCQRKNLRRHIREIHEKVRHFQCTACQANFARLTNLQEHMTTHSTSQQSSLEPPAKVLRIGCPISFREKHISRFRRVQCYTLTSSSSFTDLWVLYRAIREDLNQLLSSMLSTLEMLKFDLVLYITFKKATDPDETISCYFHSRTKRASSQAQLDELVLDSLKGLVGQVEDYVERGSGWVVQSIQDFDVHISQYHPVRGSSYLPLRNKLKNRQAVVNVKNIDNKCFLWSVLAALHPVDRSQRADRVTHYRKHANTLNLQGIMFPTPINQVAQFEHQNGISITVYGYSDEEDEIKVLHLTENPDASKQIALLLYNNQHYCWIKAPERFLRAENYKTHRAFQCSRCLHLFHSPNQRDKHLSKCTEPDIDACEMPEDTKFKFTNIYKMQRLPYAIYADFECLLQKTDTCLPDVTTSATTEYQRHVPCGYGAAEVYGCCSDNIKRGQTLVYRGEDAVRQFLDRIISWGERFQDTYNHQKPIEMSQQDEWHFNSTNSCNICKQTLERDRVADHCHLCGTYRGACHSQCNLGYRLSRNVVVVLHNLRRYDGHLLLERLGQVASERKGVEINVIPKGMDDYLTFSLRLRYRKTSWCLRFIDSYQFLNAPLAKLVQNLADKGQDRFTMMTSSFQHNKIPLLLRKGVYPYDYMDSWNRFDEDKLPAADKFACTLTGEEIAEEDYQHAQQIWSEFNIKNLGEYHDLYLLTDVLLLADVFESFRLFCLGTYHLDPAHYFTAPSFSWDACLKYTGVEMELLDDPEMYCFLESGIRGGISTITHRYAKANNHLLPDYDAAKASSYIMYLDCNNLYGNSMIFPLPISSFHWIDPSTINVQDVSDNAKEGYILEVDLEYPQHLHDSHNDYPLAVERFQVTNDMLSPYCDALRETLSVSNGKTEKLVPSLCHKENYILHYRNLKLYLSLGLKIKRIHRVLAFKQEAWMAPYIHFNTEMRKDATSAFEKDLFKLLNNSVFGKTMENVRKYIDVKLVCNEDKVVKLATEPQYNGFKVLADSLYAVKMKRTTVKLNKPIYVGFTVLDISKYIMYDFHYNYVLPKYGSNTKLLFTDTDSLCYHIYTDNVYADMHNDCQMFDFSDYAHDHKCYNATNKKVMGKFKDELHGVPVVEFVGLRAKMYSLLDVTDNEKKRAKGVKKSVVSQNITHSTFKRVLFDGSSLKHCMNFIRADCCTISSVVQNKTSLSAYDDKRYILDDACSSYAYGHYKINISNNNNVIVNNV